MANPSYAILARDLEKQFRKHSDARIASGQAAYMRNQFKFLGLKTPDRRALAKDFFRRLLKDQPAIDLRKLAFAIWGSPYREMHYSALQCMELAIKRGARVSDIRLLEKMLKKYSWWDSVDSIAPMVGMLCLEFPALKKTELRSWRQSSNFWLQRVCLIFQLRYKKQTDEKWLYQSIDLLKSDREFFIQKAIGWALREYSKTNRDSVKAYVAKSGLEGLALREASKYL